MKRPYVVYTFVSDDYYDGVGTPQFINSFKKFHPDIPLVVFRQDIVSQLIDGHDINWLNAKPVFANLLKDQFQCVVNMDADTIVLGRLDEVFSENYDIGSALNLNDYENTSIEGVSEDMYLQAGLIASRVPEFWDIWLERSKRDAWRCKCAENDTMNMVIYENPQWKLKIFDKDKDYYGCKSLGREKEFVVKDAKVMCRGQQVKAYHAAKGPNNMPKLSYDKLLKYGFSEEVAGYAMFVGNYGTTAVYETL